ncbi:MAG: hypothetical protein MZV70_29735 [Desulfobacterales bacterium]|nr:hypothetical protein [Desulfobacterales bacterium]
MAAAGEVFFRFGGVTDPLGVDTVLAGAAGGFCYFAFSPLLFPRRPRRWWLAAMLPAVAALRFAAGRRHMPALALMLRGGKFLECRGHGDGSGASRSYCSSRGLSTRPRVVFLQKSPQPSMPPAYSRKERAYEKVSTMPARSVRCPVAWAVALGGIVFPQPGDAHAHRVNIFAWVEGDTVLVECKYRTAPKCTKASSGCWIPPARSCSTERPTPRANFRSRPPSRMT